MSKELDIVLEKVYGHTDLTKVVREDTYTSLGKIDEMKSSWSDLFDALPDMYSNYSKKSVKAATGGSTSGAETNSSVKNMARRGKPEMPAQSKGETPKKIEPVQTPSQGLGSKPVGTPKSDAKPAEAPKSAFKQAWEKARAEAGKKGNAATGTFKFTNSKGETKTYQTNADPGTGAEKYVTAKHQHDTGVTGSSKAPETPDAPKPETPKDDTGVSVNPNASNSAPEKTTDQKVQDLVDKNKEQASRATPLPESFVMVKSNKYRII